MALGHEAAGDGNMAAKAIVLWIIEGQEVSKSGRERLLNACVEKSFLVLLLGFIAPAVKSMQGPTCLGRSILHTAMPQVGVDHNQRSRSSGYP